MTTTRGDFETMTIRLPAELAAAVKAEAKRRDMTTEDLLAVLVSQAVPGRKLTFEEMQQRQAEAFAQSGMTEEELGEYVNDFVHRVVRGGERQPDGTMKYPK